MVYAFLCRGRAAAGDGQMNPMETFTMGSVLRSLPIDIIYIFSLAGKPARRLEIPVGLGGEGMISVEYIELVR